MTNKKGLYEKYFKRLQDLLLSSIALILLSPILLILAILIRLKLGGPVLFTQKRPGIEEKIFNMYKFRTMTDERDEYGQLLSDSLRITPFGRFLRSTSLDELPELWNIVRGDMSIVGPRPQLIKDMMFMTIDQRVRHSVMPGLTGLAQIKGRNNISWEAKLIYDLEYIDSITFINDFKILFLTVINVFKREGITMEGMDTAEDLGDYLLRNGRINDEVHTKGLKKAERYGESVLLVGGNNE
ncbi:sugar transferase [Paenibacillus sp. B-A-8]|uniref:sugar transferase n=1 Tax=Paenibacillus sp. B-A-8 TaxID=3400419 RepID=UPI003B024339